MVAVLVRPAHVRTKKESHETKKKKPKKKQTRRNWLKMHWAGRQENGRLPKLNCATGAAAAHDTIYMARATLEALRLLAAHIEHTSLGRQPWPQAGRTLSSSFERELSRLRRARARLGVVWCVRACDVRACVWCVGVCGPRARGLGALGLQQGEGEKQNTEAPRCFKTHVKWTAWTLRKVGAKMRCNTHRACALQTQNTARASTGNLVRIAGGRRAATGAPA